MPPRNYPVLRQADGSYTPGIHGALNELQLRAALGWRFPTPKHMLFFEVKTPVGYAPVPHSRADAVVVGRWAKTQHIVHGAEFKSSRQDWLRELSKPQKSDTVKQFCDYWWLVTGEKGLAHEAELPSGWGLLEPSAFGELFATRQAERLSPIDRAPLMAALLNKAVQSMQTNRPEPREGVCAGCASQRKCYVLHEKLVCIVCRKKTPWRLS